MALTDDTGPRSGHYEDAAELDAELAEIQDALVEDGPGAGRLGRGRGAALAGRDVRVPPRLARDPPAQRGPPAALWPALGRRRPSRLDRGRARRDRSARCWRRSAPSPRSRRGSARRRAAASSCRSRPTPATRPTSCAWRAIAVGRGRRSRRVLDVVPLFESSDALTAAGPILDALLRDPGYRRAPRRRAATARR